MSSSVPATTRAKARAIFLRAIARQTQAIQELLVQSRSNAERELGGDRELFAVSAGHPFFEMAFRPSQASLLGLARDARFQQASAWARQWNLDVHWIAVWATFASLVWEAMFRCRLEGCRYGCHGVRNDVETAIAMTTSVASVATFCEEPLLFSLLRNWTPGGNLEEALPPDKRSLSPAMSPPHPLLEPRTEFLERAKQAWDDNVGLLETTGIDLSVPRKLEQHCAWLVRFVVLRERSDCLRASRRLGGRLRALHGPCPEPCDYC